MARVKATKSGRPVVELRGSGDVPASLAPALEGHWTELPERLSVHELNVLAHMVSGYTIAEEHLDREVFELTEGMRRVYREHRRWDGSAVELIAAFFAVVRGWRGLYDGPHDGDEHHAEAQSLYEAVVCRLREHPEEVEFVPIQGS